jgi:hypothetical protein
MANATNITNKDLDVLATGANEDATSHNVNVEGTLTQVGVFAAHLAFYPLAFFALVPGATDMHLGGDYSALAMIGLLISGFVVGMAKTSALQGALINAGSILIVIGLILGVPAFFGYIIFSVMAVAGGGLAGVALIWKGALLCAFLWWYIK